MTLYTMTHEQKAYLDSLVCQRVHKDSESRELIGDFFNFRNPRLVMDLHEGRTKDRNGETAYYIVKDPAANTILLYFSLRCGSLHTPDPYRRIQAELKKNQALYDAARGKKYAPKWAQEQFHNCVAKGMSAERLIRDTEDRLTNLKETLKRLKKDAKDDPSQVTVHTIKNFSGVEMVHFCKNDLAKLVWERSSVGKNPMGATLFWYFVLPVVQKTTELVGCKYVYLFAADSSAKQSLVGYYLEDLHFNLLENLSSHKPVYDLQCMPMYRSLGELERYQKDYIRNFNRPAQPEE